MQTIVNKATSQFLNITLKAVLELSNGEVGGARLFISWVYTSTEILGLEGWGGGSTPVNSNTGWLQ